MDDRCETLGRFLKLVGRASEMRAVRPLLQEKYFPEPGSTRGPLSRFACATLGPGAANETKFLTVNRLPKAPDPALSKPDPVRVSKFVRHFPT